MLVCVWGEAPDILLFLERSKKTTNTLSHSFYLFLTYTHRPTCFTVYIFMNSPSSSQCQEMPYLTSSEMKPCRCVCVCVCADLIKAHGLLGSSCLHSLPGVCICVRFVCLCACAWQDKLILISRTHLRHSTVSGDSGERIWEMKELILVDWV